MKKRLSDVCARELQKKEPFSETQEKQPRYTPASDADSVTGLGSVEQEKHRSPYTSTNSQRLCSSSA